ncbi:CRISPR-associated endonuclease Cas2 [Candidatus Poriferisocius sp.]|uniref:CRISPR-associated endonuclease Cas2 n=1 Tax=Candidatus Poriferisocius sp. TaxID=3101276 RepID=UPI003B022EF4
MSKGRKRYLIAYDICDPKRLRKVHKTLLGYGWSMQYSVFICDLDAMELISVKSDLGDIIHHNEDSIAMIDIGDPNQRGKNCFQFMGVSVPLPTSGPVIL